MQSAPRGMAPPSTTPQRYGYINSPPHSPAGTYAQQSYEDDGSEFDAFAHPAPVDQTLLRLEHDRPSDQYDDNDNVFEQEHAAVAEEEGAEVYGDASHAPPAHVPIPDDGGVAYQSRSHLYFTYALSAWGDRMWEFSAVLFIIDLYPTSLFYSAFFGLVENLVGILFGPYVGGLIDRHDRLFAMRWAITAQNVSIAIASLVFWMSLSSLVIQTAADGSTHTHTPGWIGLAYFFILCMGAVAKIASTAAKLSLHKDWVPVMAASNTDRLTNLNSSMRRIDLTANILSPLLVGLVSWGSSPATAVAVVGVWAAVSLFVELRLVGRVYDRTAALQFKAGVKEAEAARRAEAEAAVRGQVSLVSQIGSAPATIVQRVRDFSSHFLVNMRAYRSHPVFRASLAYAMLYISLLSLGGIMTSWLKLRGVSDAVLAGVRGIAAGVGIAATFASPWMIHRWGVLQAGLVAIWLQAFLLLPVGFAFVYYFKSVTTQLVIILTFLCLSRFGLWSFDLCQTQLMQRSVDPKDAGSINGAQESLCNISYTCSFILTMIFSNPDWFAAPVCISLLSVIAAAGVYTSYTADALHTDNPFPKLETFKLHKHVHSDDALAHPEWAGDAPAAAAAAGQDGEGQGEGQEGYDHAPPGGFPHSPTAEDFAASGDQFHGGAHGQHQYAEPEYEHNQFGYEYDDPHSAINYRYESTNTNN